MSTLFRSKFTISSSRAVPTLALPFAHNTNDEQDRAPGDAAGTNAARGGAQTLAGRNLAALTAHQRRVQQQRELLAQYHRQRQMYQLHMWQSAVDGVSEQDKRIMAIALVEEAARYNWEQLSRRIEDVTAVEQTDGADASGVGNGRGGGVTQPQRDDADDVFDRSSSRGGNSGSVKTTGSFDQGDGVVAEGGGLHYWERNNGHQYDYYDDNNDEYELSRGLDSAANASADAGADHSGASDDVLYLMLPSTALAPTTGGGMAGPRAHNMASSAGEGVATTPTSAPLTPTKVRIGALESFRGKGWITAVQSGGGGGGSDGGGGASSSVGNISPAGSSPPTDLLAPERPASSSSRGHGGGGAEGGISVARGRRLGDDPTAPPSGLRRSNTPPFFSASLQSTAAPDDHTARPSSTAPNTATTNNRGSSGFAGLWTLSAAPPLSGADGGFFPPTVSPSLAATAPTTTTVVPVVSRLKPSRSLNPLLMSFAAGGTILPRNNNNKPHSNGTPPPSPPPPPLNSTSPQPARPPAMRLSPPTSSISSQLSSSPPLPATAQALPRAGTGARNPNDPSVVVVLRESSAAGSSDRDNRTGNGEPYGQDRSPTVSPPSVQNGDAPIATAASPSARHRSEDDNSSTWMVGLQPPPRTPTKSTGATARVDRRAVDRDAPLPLSTLFLAGSVDGDEGLMSIAEAAPASSSGGVNYGPMRPDDDSNRGGSSGAAQVSRPNALENLRPRGVIAVPVGPTTESPPIQREYDNSVDGSGHAQQRTNKLGSSITDQAGGSGGPTAARIVMGSSLASMPSESGVISGAKIELASASPKPYIAGGSGGASQTSSGRGAAAAAAAMTPRGSTATAKAEDTPQDRTQHGGTVTAGDTTQSAAAAVVRVGSATRLPSSSSSSSSSRQPLSTTVGSTSSVRGRMLLDSVFANSASRNARCYAGTTATAVAVSPSTIVSAGGATGTAAGATLLPLVSAAAASVASSSARYASAATTTPTPKKQPVAVESGVRTPNSATMISNGHHTVSLDVVRSGLGGAALDALSRCVGIAPASPDPHRHDDQRHHAVAAPAAATIASGSSNHAATRPQSHDAAPAASSGSPDVVPTAAQPVASPRPARVVDVATTSPGASAAAHTPHLVVPAGGTTRTTADDDDDDDRPTAVASPPAAKNDVVSIGRGGSPSSRQSINSIHHPTRNGDRGGAYTSQIVSSMEEIGSYTRSRAVAHDVRVGAMGRCEEQEDARTTAVVPNDGTRPTHEASTTVAVASSIAPSGVAPLRHEQGGPTHHGPPSHRPIAVVDLSNRRMMGENGSGRTDTPLPPTRPGLGMLGGNAARHPSGRGGGSNDGLRKNGHQHHHAVQSSSAEAEERAAEARRSAIMKEENARRQQRLLRQNALKKFSERWSSLALDVRVSDDPDEAFNALSHMTLFPSATTTLAATTAAPGTNNNSSAPAAVAASAAPLAPPASSSCDPVVVPVAERERHRDPRGQIVSSELMSRDSNDSNSSSDEGTLAVGSLDDGPSPAVNAVDFCPSLSYAEALNPQVYRQRSQELHRKRWERLVNLGIIAPPPPQQQRQGGVAPATSSTTRPTSAATPPPSGPSRDASERDSSAHLLASAASGVGPAAVSRSNPQLQSGTNCIVALR